MSPICSFPSHRKKYIESVDSVGVVGDVMECVFLRMAGQQLYSCLRKANRSIASRVNVD
jgi:hypothetical protein